MEMNHEPVYDNMPMMNSGSTPISKSLSPADDPEVKRARKILLITLIICLVLSAISLIALPILWMATLPEMTITPQVVQIGQLLMSILFYSFGIFIVYRYNQRGLRVFGWLCIICLILLGIVVVLLLISLVIALITMNQTKDGSAALATSAMTLIILIILCFTASITTVIIVKFTIKLWELIDGIKLSTTEQV